MWLHLEPYTDRPEEEVVDRSRCPWDSEPRRPSHQDKRRALQRQVLQAAGAGKRKKAASVFRYL